MAELTKRVLPKCLVCENSANGFYYGDLICATCSDFLNYFSRHHEPSENIITCPAVGQCLIDWKNYRICISCLIFRCAAVGDKHSPEVVTRHSNCTNNSALEGSSSRGDFTLKMTGVITKTADQCVEWARRKSEAQYIRRECCVCGNGRDCRVIICNACLKFFRNAKNQENTFDPCRNNKRCVINRYNRTRCKSCLFAKCLEIEMKKPSPTANSKRAARIPLRNLNLGSSDIIPASISPPKVLLDDNIIVLNKSSVAKPTEPILSYNDAIHWSKEDFSKLFGS